MSHQTWTQWLLLLQETGKDPITQEPLEIDDLVPVKTNKAVKPRPSPATSIPGLLGLFHNVSLSACSEKLRLLSAPIELMQWRPVKTILPWGLGNAE